MGFYCVAQYTTGRLRSSQNFLAKSKAMLAPAAKVISLRTKGFPHLPQTSPYYALKIHRSN